MNVVYDLDGTLSSKNTYKIFLLALFLFVCVTIQVKSVVRFVNILIRRKNKIYARVAMKREFFLLHEKIAGRVQFNEILHFVLKIFIRKNLLNNHIEAEDTLILATAAYDFYARRIAREYNFSKCLGTTREDIVENIECIGAVKKSRLIALLGEDNIDVFFTDHKDDIPTIKVAKLTYLVKPSQISLNEIRQLKAKINFSYV